MIKIWGRITSSNVQKITWLCETLDLAFERFDTGGAFGGTRDAAYLAMNPNALIPTIDDDGFILWESNTICRYLCNKAALAGNSAATLLYPGDVRARADVERWMDWGSGAIAPAITPVFYGLIRVPQEQRDPVALRAGAQKTCDVMATLDQQLEGRAFICGDHLTLADVSLGSNGHRFMQLPYGLIDFVPPALPNLRRWYDTLCSMELYRNNVVMTLT
jgi:glutathione S-transferase